MSYHITQSPILGLQLIRPSIFKDFRGEYTETYNQQDILPGTTFVQDSAILSTKGVLRGYHGDAQTTKLITCLQGAFQIVVVCIDPHDSMFEKSETLVLDDKERLTLVIPPRFVNAHQCLTDTCIFFYKQDTYYRGQKYQYTIKWDSIHGVIWPYPPILSSRDMHCLNNIYKYIVYAGDDKGLQAPEEVNP